MSDSCVEKHKVPFQVQEELLGLVYSDLRRIARYYMRQESVGHTLSPTALVHEAYIRLAEQENVVWKGRDHFIALAATMMRRVLVNHAVRKKRSKRGSEYTLLSIELCDHLGSFQDEEVSELDEALHKFEREFPAEGKIVELKFFGGLSIQEMARVLNISETTVERRWRFARAWLLRELNG